MEQWQARRVDLAALAREVATLKQELRDHEREHVATERIREQAARERDRQKRTARRYWATTLVTVIITNAGTWITLAATHSH